MNQFTSQRVDEILQAAGAGSTVFLVGAGGCGMSGLGHLLLDLGHRVAGSDAAVNEEVFQLRARGADIRQGHAAEHIDAARPALVVYSSAIRLDNAELRRAEQRQIPIVRRAVLLAALLHRQRGICVAGMHGKTTTSALLAYALENLAANPSYAIGALVPQLPRHGRFNPAGLPDGGGTPWFVIEADESDGSLREFHPECAIVLNVDEEHLDYYANLETICVEFLGFGRQTGRKLVFCADDTRLSELFACHPGAVSYGYHPLAEYRIQAKGAPARGVSAFEIWRRGEKLGDFTIQLLGEKNVSNAAAVICLLHELGYVPPRIARALAGFTGAARRQQELFRDSRFQVFEDYGHHPAEIEATLRAFKQTGPRRLLVAFQPHRFSRTFHLLKQFSTCFQAADKLWVTEIYAASEAALPGVNGALLAQSICAAGQAVDFVPTLDYLRRAVRAAMQPGDVVLFLGAGNISEAAQQFARDLQGESVSPKEQHYAELTKSLSAETVVRVDEPLARHTTFRIGGPADLYVEPASEADLAWVLQFCGTRDVPFLVVGRGSNLLIRDRGIRGVAISLSHPNFNALEVLGDRLHCGAGLKLKTVAAEARRHGLSGFEFLEGIPGSLGGGLRMNAGAMGSWLFEVVESVRLMDRNGQVQERRVGDIYIEYRGCPLLKDHIALGAVLRGVPAPPEAITERMNRYNQIRWENQPAASSAGCIFKNPPTIPAGRLIDELGLKGTRVGGAVISEAHANFIVNDGNATAQDVLNLIEIVKERARATRGIELETEVEIFGE